MVDNPFEPERRSSDRRPLRVRADVVLASDQSNAAIKALLA